MIKKPEYDKMISLFKREDYLMQFIDLLENDFLRYDPNNDVIELSTFGEQYLNATFKMDLKNNILRDVEYYDYYSKFYNDYGAAILTRYNNCELDETLCNVLSKLLHDSAKYAFTKIINYDKVPINKFNTNDVFSILVNLGKDDLKYYISVSDEVKYKDFTMLYGCDYSELHCILPNKFIKFYPKFQNVDINLSKKYITGFPKDILESMEGDRWGTERCNGGLVNTVIATMRKAALYKHQYEKQCKRRKQVMNYLMWSAYMKGKS